MRVNKINSVFLSVFVSFLLMGFALMYPSNVSGPVSAGGQSYTITPSQADYIFAFSTITQAETISLRVTPTNGDPEIKKFCFYTTSCQMDLSSYNFNTSSNYYIFAGANVAGNILFEEQ